MAKRIKVLHLLYSVCHGGIETLVLNWIKNFDLDLVDVHLAYFAGDRNREAPFLRAAELNGIEVLAVPWGKGKPFIRCARAVAKLVEDFEIDIIHTHAYYADAVGALTKALVPVKVVSTVYVWGRYELHRQLMQIMDWVSIQFHDAVTAQCRDTQRKTFWRLTPPSRIPILIAGFPAEHEAPSAEERKVLRRSQGIGDDDLLMVNVARLAPEKAQDQLLQSFRLVLDRHPRARLWISGVGLDQVQRSLNELRNRLGLESAVEFVGYRENLWPMLDAADLMVHPSHVEGVPIAVLYGMAAELPVIASRVGGLPEVIEHEHTGILVPESDVVGFADAVSRLIEDKDLSLAIGKAGRGFIQAEYSIQRAVRRVEHLYFEVVGHENRDSRDVRGTARRRA